LPELPEVEAIRRTLQPVMEGACFERVNARRPDLRFPLPPHFAARLEGQTVRVLGRRGKYLVVELSSADVLLVHLGMTGSFRVTVGIPKPPPDGWHDDRGAAPSHDHVVFEMSSGATVTFNDPRRFGSMELVKCDELPRHRTLGALGPEPLTREFDAAVLARACTGRRTPLKVALSNQRVVAGLGNIYVCEALHRARLSPRRRASTIASGAGQPRDHAYRLAAAIKRVLNEAVRLGAARLQDGHGASGDTAYSPRKLRVYDRAGARCLRAGCRGIVRRIVQGGRATFFCPACQK
jgi:formamidopyrimidine-DNA glycosylase